MKLFKSNKSKSYSTKQKAEANNPETLPPQERKSLLSISPSESGILSMNNSKTKNILPPSGLPDALSLNHAQSEFQRSVIEDPPLLRPQSAFDYIPNKNAVDDEPENSFVSAQGINLTEKKSTYNEGQNAETRPLRQPSKHGSEKVATESEMMKSLTEIGPYDVEINEKDPEKSSKLPTMKLDLNPFSEKRRPKESFHERKMSKDPSSSSRAPLIVETENVKSPDVIDFDKSKQVSETYPLTGLLESPPLEGGILETRSIPVAQDNNKLLAPDKVARDKKALSVSFVDVREEPSTILKRAASDLPGRPSLKNGDDIEIDALSPESATQPLTKSNVKKTSFLWRKNRSDSAAKKPKPQSKVVRKAWKVPVFLWILVYIVLVYIGIPFAMFFGAYGYKDDMIKAILNFGLLGFFQGIVQVLLLHQLIDVPILTKIREIEGKHRGLINPSKYLVINKIHALGILMLSTGLQMAAGITMQDLEKEVTGTAILVSCLCTTLIKALIWFIVIWIKSPRTLKNERKILDSELKEIGQIRKDFMADLYDTRKKMEIRSINQNLVPSTVPQMLSNAYMGLSSGVVHNVDVDARKLLHKVYDFSSEFKRIRFSSIKTFMILIFSIAQTLIMIHIIRLTQKTEDVAPSLLCVVLLFVAGTICGIPDLFSSPTKPELNTMKLVSLIVTSASYRFLFMDLSSRAKMIGATIIKLVYKILLYYFAALFSERIFKKFKRDKKKSILVDLYESLQEKEASHVRRPVYIFLKFTLLLEVDLFYAVVSLYLTRGASDFLNEPELTFGLKPEIEYNFYLALVLIEMGVHIIFGFLFALLTHRLLKRRAKTVTISLWKEFIKSMMENRWVIIGFKGLLLFILLFIFFNDI